MSGRAGDQQTNDFLTLAENAVRAAIETEVWNRAGGSVLGTGSAAIAAIKALRTLPVEQRMEAMGMEPTDGWEVYVAGDGDNALRVQSGLWREKP